MFAGLSQLSTDASSPELVKADGSETDAEMLHQVQV